MSTNWFVVLFLQLIMWWFIRLFAYTFSHITYLMNHVTCLYYNVKPIFFGLLIDLIILCYISFWDLTILHLIILIYIYLIEFKFYSIVKHSIKILTHHILFKRNNIFFHIYKRSHNKYLILEYIFYIYTQ